MKGDRSRKQISRRLCCAHMRRGAQDEMPRNPVGMWERMGWSPRRVMRDAHNTGNELTDQSCMTALQKMTGLVERPTKDERKLDSEMKERLRMILGRP